MSQSRLRKIVVHVFPTAMLILAIVLGIGLSATAAQPDRDKLAGQPAELSAWAYAYRADREVQDSPEAYLVLRRLARLDHAYRPLSLLLSQESEKMLTSYHLVVPASRKSFAATSGGGNELT